MERSTLRMMLALFAAAALFAIVPANARPVESAETACAVVKAHVMMKWHVKKSMIAFCDHIRGPSELYVLALQSKRTCDGICSTNMGWYAVQKATGRVFEWNVGEFRLGPEV